VDLCLGQELKQGSWIIRVGGGTRSYMAARTAVLGSLAGKMARAPLTLAHRPLVAARRFQSGNPSGGGGGSGSSPPTSGEVCLHLGNINFPLLPLSV